MTSFVLEPRLWASSWIAALSSSGMRRSTTGLDPGSALLRLVGTYAVSKRSARRPTATSLRLTLRRALSRTSACLRDAGMRTSTPLRSDLPLCPEVLAVKVLAL